MRSSSENHGCLRWLILALGVLLSTKLVPGISYDRGSTLVVVVLLLSLCNVLLKPLLLLLGRFAVPGQHLAGDADQPVAVMGGIGDDGAGLGDAISGPVGRMDQVGHQRRPPARRRRGAACSCSSSQSSTAARR